IDRSVFEPILEFDIDEEGFSELMVNEYFDQAVKTFEKMDDALAKKNLLELSSLGHFLKGSSAALGLSKVQLSCEHIQHYGQLKEDTNTITEAEAIVKITKSLARVREEFAEAKVWLESFYE
ncbi:signal transduction histidine kinase, partial [Russula aff. rugulosa BPL654]